MFQPHDDQFLNIGSEMLECFEEGTIDYEENFDCPYDYGSMRYAAWCAGYTKAFKENNK